MDFRARLLDCRECFGPAFLEGRATFLDCLSLAAKGDEAELLSWTGAPFTYGRIDAETGAIAKVGTIERVARLLDMPVTGPAFGTSTSTYEAWLFDDDAGEDTVMALAAQALDEGVFDGFEPEDVLTLLTAARKVERITRHKENSNCPSYGDRASLVEAGILTNDLPSV